jgi:hypothetical protein
VVFEEYLELAGHILDLNYGRSARIRVHLEYPHLSRQRYIAAALVVFSARLEISAKCPAPLVRVMGLADDVKLPAA